MSVNLELIERGIVDAIRRVVMDQQLDGQWIYSSRLARTRRVKNALRELGRQFGNEVWGSFPDDTDKQNTEWLCDLCWTQCRDNNWRQMTSLALACEIEWESRRDCIIEDFLKLTVVEAELRLFVFTLKKQDRIGQFELLRDLCPSSKNNRYLAVGCAQSPPLDIEYRAWTR